MGLQRLLYNIGLGAYHKGIQFYAPFNVKAQQWVAGRKNWQAQLASMLGDKPVIWVHCASLGEYEQGKPIIEALEKRYPGWLVLTSFYSPSGYEVVKRREPHRPIIYLPPDNEANAKAYITMLKPTMAFFIKYEFWYYYLLCLHQQRIPTYLVSGIFRAGQPFFKSWGALHRTMLDAFTHFFVQDNTSMALLQGIGYSNVTISGDTRFDRVGDILANPQPLTVMANFKGASPLFIAGSIWPADEVVLLPILPSLISQGWKVVLAPHDIQPQHIERLQKMLGSQAVLYSNCSPQNIEPKVLIIDNVGLLAHVYKYGNVAYIGGGFGKGIHNVLEPAANGLPVVFGPRYDKFKEARDLVAQGGAWPIGSFAQLQAIMQKLLGGDARAIAGTAAQNYVINNQGATERVLQTIAL